MERMTSLVSRNIGDLSAERKHSDLYNIALCPYEAKTIIGEIVVLSITAMIEKLKTQMTIPVELCTCDPEKVCTCKCEEKWLAILNQIVEGFEIGVHDCNTPENIAKFEEAALLLVQWYHHLFI